MLAQDHPFAAVQLHIEGVLAGGAHFVGAAADVIAVVVILHRVLIVHQGDGAHPEFLGIPPGFHADAAAFHDGPPLQLIQRPLDPVGAGLLNGDVGLGLAVFVGALLADGGDPPVHRRFHHGVGKQVLTFLHLGLFGFQLQLRFLQVDLVGLDLNGILQLVSRIRPFPVLFQLDDLLAVIFDGGGKLLQFQLLFFQGQLQLIGVIGKEGLPLGHVVALSDKKLLHHLVLIPLDLRDILGYHHPAEPVRHTDPAQLGKVRDLLHKNLIFFRSAG